MQNTQASVVILGSTSGIARAIAFEFARRGYRIVLGARDQEENEIIAADIRVRYQVDVHALSFDALAYDQHAAFYEQCVAALEEAPGGLVLCYGYLDNQAAAQADFTIARKTLDINFTSAVSVLEIFAAKFETRKSGFIAAISSVAGDRGRQSNYLYGSAKAGLTAYLQGLRNRLFASNVSVLTVKPGFVDTKMIFGKPGVMLAASPESVGKSIAAAILKKRDVIYTPWFWRFIMLIIRHVPEVIFKRLKL